MNTPFDFGAAITQPFQTSGGAEFGRRLWFWTAVPMVITLLIALPFIAPAYGQYLIWLTDYMAMIMGGGLPDGDTFSTLKPVLKSIWPSYLLLTIGMWATWIMGEAALHRKTLLGTEYSGRPIALGGDEFKVFLAQLGVFGIFMAITFLGSIAMGFITVAMGAISSALAAIFVLIGTLVMLGAIIYYPMRLLPAAGLSVLKGEPRLRSALAVSKGKFWPIFGAYLVVMLGGSIVMNIIMSLGMMAVLGEGASTAMSGMGDSADVTAMIEGAAQRLKNPLVILAAVLSITAYAAIAALFYLCISGIGSYVVKWHQGNDPAAPFS
ncbi:MAG: hypothetical protein V3U82_00640 [Robiginitomaculum sp.]